MDIYFPMAGQGARFGHQFKPFLTIDDQTFIEAAVSPFRAFAPQIRRFVFVYLETQEQQFEVSARLAAMFPELPFDAVRLATPTRGPAETIGRAVAQREGKGAAMICDCDHSFDVAPLFARFAAPAPFDALLPVWSLAGESLASWSVADVAGSRVLAIAEKQQPPAMRGEPLGVIGCYGFADVAKATTRGAALGATNFSDILAEMLAANERVEAARIAWARFFGDPERLARETSAR